MATAKPKGITESVFEWEGKDRNGKQWQVPNAYWNWWKSREQHDRLVCAGHDAP